MSPTGSDVFSSPNSNCTCKADIWNATLSLRFISGASRTLAVFLKESRQADQVYSWRAVMVPVQVVNDALSWPYLTLDHLLISDTQRVHCERKGDHFPKPSWTWQTHLDLDRTIFGIALDASILVWALVGADCIHGSIFNIAVFGQVYWVKNW